MANPAYLAVTELAANSATARPAGNVIDTNGVVPLRAADLKGRADRLIIEVTNGALRAVDVELLAGDDPPAVRAGLGDYSNLAIATNAVWLIGPFESARFTQSDGTISVKFTGAAGAADCTVRVYLLPKTA